MVRNEAYNLWGVVVGHLAHFVGTTSGQRARQDDDAGTRHTEKRRVGLSSPGERTGDYADRWHSSGFGYYCVVETPRRAGASISNSVDHHVALRQQRVQSLFGASGAVGKFGGVHYFLCPVFLH